MAEPITYPHFCLATSGTGRHRQAASAIFQCINHGIAVFNLSAVLQYHCMRIDPFIQGIRNRAFATLDQSGTGFVGGFVSFNSGLVSNEGSTVKPLRVTGKAVRP